MISISSSDEYSSINSDVSLYQTWAISIAVVGSLVTVAAMCLCCYGDSDDDDLTSLTVESDMKDYSKMSLMSFGIPDQDVNVARIQPELYKQTSVNKKLGIELQYQQLSDVTDPENPDSGDEEGSGGRGDTPPPSASITGPPHLLGRIQIHLRYDFERMTLNLNLLTAEHLPAKDFSGTSDPYVKIMLLPDRKHRLVSNIRRKCLNPRWDEMFSFEGYPFAKLADKTLCLQVLDYDRFSRDDPIGEVYIPLKDVDIANGVTLWQPLQPSDGEAGKLGQILVSLCHQPSLKRIMVGIISARGLVAKDVNGLSDPYVKLWLTYDGKRVKKQKTKCKPKTLNPDFNETFVFEVETDKLPLTCLSIVVMDRDLVTQNELIGRIAIGPCGGPVESKHWKEMLAKPQQMIERWHVLKNA